MVPEAPLEDAGHGLVPQGEGWYVLNARETRWLEGRLGAFCNFEGEPRFSQLGINLNVLQPGEPMAMYHWERDQEDFLVLGGEALLVAEGEERQLRQWDLVHCPAGTKHVIVGAGEGPAWCSPSADEAAIRHDAGVERETTSADEAYARFAKARPAPYRGGWLGD